MDNQFVIQVSFVSCRSCHWIMGVAQDKYFICENSSCDEFRKHFKIVTIVAEVPMDQARGDSIPGVNKSEGENGGA